MRDLRSGFRRSRVLATAGAAAIALVLSACGSEADDSSAGGDTSQAATTAADTGSADTGSADTGAGASSGAGDTAGSGAEDTAGSGAEDTAGSGAEDTAGSGAEGTGAAAEPSVVEMTGDASKVSVGLAYDIGGRGDQSFNDSAAAGLDRAEKAGVTVIGELEAAADETDAAKEDRLHQLATDGANVVLAVGFAYATPLSVVAPEYPDVHFGIVDDASLCNGSVEGDFSNVACLTFAEEQGSYLVGVAAALKSESGKVGFVGGVDTPLIQKFQAGFEAGVKDTNADATIEPKYITVPPDFTGFNAPDKGETIAKGMYDSGIDVIYAAAGGSGAGVFKAAKEAGTWGIGVDSDQYNAPTLANVKDVIMTSMLKNVDVAVWDDIAAVVNGEPLSGQKAYDLTTGGIGYSTSGGFVDDITDQLDAAKAGIISGEITVPTTPGG